MLSVHGCCDGCRERRWDELDAINAVRGRHPLRPYTPPPGLHVHRLESGVGVLSPLATQVTGRPYFKAEALRAARTSGDSVPR